MPRILIIGCGNPLRCDDGLAWHVTEKLKAMDLTPGIKFITQHQLKPELAEPVSESDLVLFVDAAQNGNPGEIRCEAVSHLNASHAFSHEISPSALLALARELYDKGPRAFIFSLCGECFDHGDTLSTVVEKTLPEFLERIVDTVQNDGRLLLRGENHDGIGRDHYTR